MSRSRSRGSKSLSAYEWPGVYLQARLQFTVNGTIRELREVEIPSTGSGYLDDRQTMSDVIGHRGSFNPVTHVKRYIAPAPKGLESEKKTLPPMNWPYSQEWTTYGTRLYDLSGNVNFQGVYADLTTLPCPAFPAIDWSDIVYQVGSQLDGHMVTGQNLLVDLMQITQTIGMFKNPFNLRKLGSSLDKLSLSKIAKSGAGTYLEYKFGWENIYRDMQQLAAVWSEVRAHQSYLEQTAGKYVSVAARQQDSVPYTSSVPVCSMYGAIGDSYARLVISRVERVAAFSIDLRRSPQALLWGRLEQVANRLGVRDLGLALWDCVPYSFVVDWFTHLNRFIGQRSIDFNTFDLRRIGYSHKYRWFGHWETKTDTYDGYGRNTSAGSSDEVLIQEMYERFPGFPSGTTSVGLFGDLNKTQIAEGIALIIQRL